MLDSVNGYLIEISQSCQCCLQRPITKNLKIPYTHLGETEIYSDMLSECFDIHFSHTTENDIGICDTCIARLRDAREFKLQVQRCQSQMRKASPMKDRMHAVKAEIFIRDELLLYNQPPVKPESDDEDSTSRLSCDSTTTHAGMAQSGLGNDYECQTCHKTFECADKFNMHTCPCQNKRRKGLQTNTDIGNKRRETSKRIKLSCEICQKQFSNKSHLNTHKRVHTGEKPYTCEYCNKTFALKCTYNTHKRIHTGYKPYSCEVCQKKFKQKHHLSTHMFTHTGEKPHACDVCQKQFTHKSHLNTHLQTHMENRQYQYCEICKKQFTQKSHLICHQRTHTGEKPYSCDVCEKQFRYKCSLNIHKRIHAGEKPHACEVCQQQFTQKSTLTTHMLVHTGHKPHSCDVCEKQFSSKRRLEYHTQTHPEKRNGQSSTQARNTRFCCEICGKQFLHKNYLVMHINGHMGIKPYTCDTCNKRFTFQSSLKAHKLIHTGEKSFACEICRKRFGTKANLKGHMLIHSTHKQHSCEICSKRFTHKCALNVHIKLLHTGEKPHVCKLCDKAFAVQATLKRHMAVHTGEKPYGCDICSKQFASTSNLKKHKVVHTSQKLYRQSNKHKSARKRGSSSLKSQRAPRAPFLELEFNVGTPQDQAKSRRVSFTRRTGDAEFEINEATTTWKNVYEEHNKSLKTLANESGGARHSRVAHLGGPDAEVKLLSLLSDAPETPRPQFELTEHTDHNTMQLLFIDANPTWKYLTDSLERRKTVVDDYEVGNISMTDVVPANIVEKDSASQTEPIITACKETVMSRDEIVNFYKTGSLPDKTGKDKNLTATNTESKKAVVFEKDDDNLSTTRAVEPKEEEKTNTTLLLQLTDCRKSIYENEDYDISMTEVVPAGEEIKANVTLPNTARTRTVVCESEDGNESMTHVVPNIIVEDRMKLDPTANNHRKCLVVDHTNRSMAGEVLSHEKKVEIIDRSNRKTIVYQDMEGDVSMTEAAPTGSEIHSETISQAIEPEIIYKDNNDLVAMNGVTTSSIELEQSSTKTSVAVSSRQSLQRDTKDTMQMRNVSTLQKSLADEVLVYNTSVCNNAQQTEACDSNSLLHQYIQEANDRRCTSLLDSSDLMMGVQSLARNSDGSVIGTSGTFSTAFDTRSQSLMSDTSMPNTVESDISSHSQNLYPILVEDRKSMVNRLSHNLSPVRDDFSKSSPPDSKLDLESQNPKPIASERDVSENNSLERVSLLGVTSHGSPPPRKSTLDALSRSLVGQDLATDVLSRSLAPNRVSILKELSPKAFENTGISPPSSVLDMSSMDGEILDTPQVKLYSDTSTNTMGIMTKNAPVRECCITRDSDGNVKSDEESEKSYEDEILSDTRPQEDKEVVNQLQRRFTEHHVTFDEKCIAVDVSMEGETQTQRVATNTRASQAGGVDETTDILDALSDFTQTREFDIPDVKLTKSSTVPDRKFMVRSLKEISMAQALMKTEMEQSEESEEVASLQREAVKTLRFDGDSPHESPGVLDVPVELEQRRSHPIPYYLQNVSDNVKDLIDDLIKPMADVSTYSNYAPRRDSSIQTDRPSSQINLVTSSQRSLTPSKPKIGILKDPTWRLSPPELQPIRRSSLSSEIRRMSQWPESGVVVFDPWHPLNNVVLPAAAREPHRYSPAPRPPAALVSRCPSLDTHETQTERLHSQQLLQCEMALITNSLQWRGAMDPFAGSDDESRKRSHVLADPSQQEVRRRPAIKKVSSSVKMSRRPRSPTMSEPTIRSASPETIPFVSGTLSVTSQGLVSGNSMVTQQLRDADNVVSKIDMLPFMGSWECTWESRSTDTWSFLTLRGRLRLLLRLQHKIHNQTRTAVRADTPVTHVALTHNAKHESSDPILGLTLCLAASSLGPAAAAVSRAGAVLALLQRCVRVARVALRWARVMHHARMVLAYSLTGFGLLSLKVANIPLRCVWEVTMQIVLASSGGSAWPRAADVTVTPVLAHWSPTPTELRRLLAHVPQDWRHVPKTLWKVFKYLKYIQPEDDQVLGARTTTSEKLNNSTALKHRGLRTLHKTDVNT